VRELGNVLERAVVHATGDVLLAETLPPLDLRVTPLPVPAGASEDPAHFPTLDEMERVHILRALELARGHKGRTCELLGISRPTLERKLQKYGVAEMRTSERE